VAMASISMTTTKKEAEPVLLKVTVKNGITKLSIPRKGQKHGIMRKIHLTYTVSYGIIFVEFK
jgi:hypothetical protein